MMCSPHRLQAFLLFSLVVFFLYGVWIWVLALEGISAHMIKLVFCFPALLYLPLLLLDPSPSRMGFHMMPRTDG